MSVKRTISLSDESNKMLEELCSMGLFQTPASTVIDKAIIVFYESVQATKNNRKEEN